MGAFNEWAKGSFLEGYKNRDVVTVAENIVFGAAFLNRIKILADQGIILRGESFKARPVEKSKLEKYLTVIQNRQASIGDKAQRRRNP